VTQADTESAAHPATKFALGDLRIEGNVHDRDGVRDRILNKWKDREFDDAKELADSVMEVGVRGDFQDRGYFKVFANDPVTQPLGLVDGKQRILIIVTITEGDQFRVGNFAIENEPPDRPLSIPAATLREQFHLRQGDLFNVSEVRAGLERIKGLYDAKGYGGTKEEPATAIDDAHHLISFTLRITEGLRTK
jgi:outer membrane protein assembly factor BamA